MIINEDIKNYYKLRMSESIFESWKDREEREQKGRVHDVKAFTRGGLAATIIAGGLAAAHGGKALHSPEEFDNVDTRIRIASTNPSIGGLEVSDDERNKHALGKALRIGAAGAAAGAAGFGALGAAHLIAAERARRERREKRRP